jgi:hypothetical protein
MYEPTAEACVTIIAPRSETRSQRIIDTFAIMAVVGRTVLQASCYNREAVHVQRCLPDSTTFTGGSKVSEDRLSHCDT